MHAGIEKQPLLSKCHRLRALDIRTAQQRPDLPQIVHQVHYTIQALIAIGGTTQINGCKEWMKSS